jgi:hypothetical protein
MPAEFLPSKTGLSAENPWPGLQAFGTQDVEFFQGRGDKIKELFSEVGRSILTVFYGHSGLGKTSLLQAGLFPQLKQADFLPILLRLDHGNDAAAPPLADQVKEAIAAALTADKIEAPAPDMGEPLWAYFHQKDLEFWDERNRFVQPVLIFDQFEEIYTRGQETAVARARSEAFLAEMESLSEKRPPAVWRQQLEANPRLAQRFDYDRQTYRIVLAMREDYLPFLLKERRRFAGVGYHQCRLERMTGQDAWNVLLQPRGAGLVEPATALRILQALTTPARDQAGAAAAAPVLTREEVDGLEVDPALLSVTCRELNLVRQSRGLPRITAELVDEMGGSILDQFYETALEGVPASARAFIEERLLSDSGEYRQAVPVEEACARGQIAREDIARLVNRRLLHIEDYRGVAQLEFTHDRLTRVARKSREDRHRREAEERERQQAAQREESLRRERDAQRRRSRRLTAAAAALLLITASLAGGMIYVLYHHFWSHDVYYANCTHKWGIYQGVGARLSAEEVKHLENSFRFHYRGSEKRGKLLWMEAVNGHGLVTTEHEIGTILRTTSETRDQGGQVRECRWEYSTDADGRVTYEMAFDKAHRLVWGFVYSPSNESEPRTRRAHYVGPSGFPQRQRDSGAEYVTITYDAKGHEIQYLYESAAATPQKGLDDAYGRRFEVNAAGQKTKIISLNAQGEPMNDTSWNAILSHYYDKESHLIADTAQDVQNHPVLTSNWTYETKYTNDRWGNEISRTFFDLAGQPCVGVDGYATERTEYNEWGNPVRTTYLGADGKPCLNKNKVAGSQETYDDLGREIKVAYFDTAGRPCLNKELLCSVTYEYDQQDRIVRRRFYGPDGQPCLNDDGYAGWEADYNEQGLLWRTVNFGVDGKLCLDSSKVAIVERQFDPLGRETKVTYYDTRSQPCLSKTDIAGWWSIYDTHGLEIERHYFGLTGEPRLSSDGYATLLSEYDEAGDVKRITYLGTNGKPLLQPHGYASVESDYDDRGHAVRVASLDADGRPCVADNKIAGWRAVFNERGQEVERRFFGPDGQPCVLKDGNAGWRREFDARGLETRSVPLDLAGQPELMPGDRYAFDQEVYDARGNLVLETYLDLAGKPCLSQQNIAGRRLDYDARGNLVRESLLGPSGQIQTSTDGYAVRQSTYDERNRERQRLFFDDAGKPCLFQKQYAGWRRDYDVRGNTTRETHLKIDGTPLMQPDGFATIATTYDDRSNILRVAFLDAQDHPCLNDEGLSIRESTYDERGLETSRLFFGPDGKPSEGKVSYAGWSKDYDERGRETRFTYLGLDHKPLVYSDGYATQRVTYNAQDQVTGRAYFDAANKPCLQSRGYASVRFAYDDEGKLSKSRYFGADGAELAPVPMMLVISEVNEKSEGARMGLKSGDVLIRYAGWSRFSEPIVEDGNKAMQMFLDERGKPGTEERPVEVMRDGALVKLAAKPGPLGISVAYSEVMFAPWIDQMLKDAGANPVETPAPAK